MYKIQLKISNQIINQQRFYSKKHNIQITPEMKNDEKTMHIFDHIGLNT